MMGLWSGSGPVWLRHPHSVAVRTRTAAFPHLAGHTVGGQSVTVVLVILLLLLPLTSKERSYLAPPMERNLSLDAQSHFLKLMRLVRTRIQVDLVPEHMLSPSHVERLIGMFSEMVIVCSPI